MITVRTTREHSQVYDADRAKVEKDGTLTLYKWLRIGRYKCPLNNEHVATFPPGKWIDFTKDSE